MNLGLVKILSIFSSTSISAGSFLAEADNLINISDSSATILTMLVEGFLTIIGNVIYYICQFALTLIDFFQVIVYKFLGITTKVENFKPYDPNNPLIRFLTNETVIDVLRTAMIVAVVLVIVFTIFSIIMGEWNRAANETEYSVRMVWSRAFRSLFGMVIFPAAFMAVIILINALLASFAAVMSHGANVSLGGQVFALCSYDANVYRNYANNNKRIPIYIDFYDPYADGTYTRYTTDELAAIYGAFTTEGTELFNQFANKDFLSFSDAVSYSSRNNSLTNNHDAYGKYEKFVCTAEQYQVMADFVDYAVANGITYYYKPISDDDIEWKYVDSAQYNSETGSLRLTYKDYSNLNDGQSYSVVYEASPYIVSSPIQDALGTLSTLLSLDGNYYSMIDYLEGTINQVSWATDKVLLKFSENYRDTSQWTAQDQILLYEYYRYSYNNTLQDYTFADLENGVYVDAYTIDCQYYRDYTNSYVTLISYKVVIINGNYYLIDYATDKVYNPTTEEWEDKFLYDDYGDHLYEIKNEDSAIDILNDITYYNNNLEEGQQELGVYIELIDKWYSTTYGNDGVELPENSMKEYLADTVGTLYEEIYDEEGIVIDHRYGFKNPNGFYKEVDRIRASQNVKQVDWANKLMGDLKAIYRDLNLDQLITTGEWLKLFNSQIEMINGEYVADFDTSMISPQGIVLSEVFLGILKESDGSNLADYMFASRLSEAEQRELILALMGEEYYETTHETITYFVDTFNLLFTPLLEMIMRGEAQPFVVGEVTSVQLYTYKAYMCSLLLSSDSAKFFLDIAKDLIVMYQFQYDVHAVEPSDYTLALNIVKEYLNPQIYGPSTGKIPYSYDFTKLAIEFERYLDVNDNGVVEQEDLLLIYRDDNTNSQIDLNEITKENTPLELLNQINTLLDQVYISFADIVIDENVNNSVYYGINLKLEDYGVDLEDYGFTKNHDYTYSFSDSKYHTYSQLPSYTTLCARIYSAMQEEFEKGSSDVLAVRIYNNVKENLQKQQVQENSNSWPEYMVSYKQYLTGNIQSSEIVFSHYVNTKLVSGRLNEYKVYEDRHEKHMKAMEDMEYMDYFNKWAWLLELFTLDRSDFLRMMGIYGNSNALINRYYSDDATEESRLLTMNELLRYSDLNSDEFELETTVDGWLKQKQVSNQLEAIIKYAVDNNLIADVGDISVLGTVHFYNYSTEPDHEDELIETTDAIIDKAHIEYLQEYAFSVNDALASQMSLHEYYKYHIPYAVRMNSTENVSKTFGIIVNNHHYSLTLTMPTPKLAEYLLGGTYLDYLGFEATYVDKDYKGFFNIDYNADGTIDFPSGEQANFDTINTFINNLAEVTMRSHYMSNLFNITKSNLEDTPVSQLHYTETVIGEGVLGYQKDYLGANPNNAYVKLILLNILENQYLEESIVRANMLDSEFNNAEEFYASAIEYIKEMELDKACDAFNGTISYLTGSIKEYHNMSAKQLRLELLDALANYQANSASSSMENKHRYITLFYMLCSDFVEKPTGSNDIYGNPNKDIYFTKDTTTQGLILKLAGIEDMPAELLVGLEYESLYNNNVGFDENNGDYFIICTYDSETQKYIPFLMNSGKSEDAYATVTDIIDGDVGDTTWLQKYGYGIANTSYYAPDSETQKDLSYPVIAKGVITSEGMPTAIRQIDGVTEFYRDNMVIRNTSELQLNAYFMTTENLSTNYNLFSMLTNSISKVFTGKTLIEHAYSNIPRFAIDSDIRLPMGVDEQLVSLTQPGVTADYTFSGISGLSSQNFYKTTQINFLVLIIAIIALIPMLIKAVYGVFGRVVDITLYYCMSPIMMSTMALGKNTGDGKEEMPIYSAWFKELSKKTLSVFGYVVGFQIFFTLIPFFSSVEFISDMTLFQSLPLFKHLSPIFVNRIVNIVMIICSAYLITEAPKVFASILGQSDGFSDGEAVKNNIKSTLNEVKESLNGTKAVATINYAKESVKDSLGLNTLANAAGAVKKVGAKVVSKGAEYYLRAQGVPKEAAKKLTGAMYESVKKEEDIKKALRDERKLKAYNAYHQQVGIEDSEGLNAQIGQIDQYLYKQGMRKRSEKQHKAIQDSYKKLSKKKKK